jgi:ubiquinone/menaquinone biosynthesis C-methylase UbiE
MSSSFTEKQTEKYYDAEDSIYQTFWDANGSVHWGLFDKSTGDDFLKACDNLNWVMVEKGQIQSSSNVLDLGCGNGATAIWLSQQTHCHVTGIDLSGVRVKNAQVTRDKLRPELRERLIFKKASAMNLPFDAGTFSHVWSQAVIYHVPDKDAVIQEIYRVLQPGGILVFDDLTKPQAHISLGAQKYVYNRLLYDTPFSFQTYQQALRDHGFTILEAHDLSQHLKTSYLRLIKRLPKSSGNHAEHYNWLALAYQETANAVDRKEVGWGLFVCQK